MANDWTAEQRISVLNDAWQKGVAYCPLDGAVMQPKFHSSSDSCFMIVLCPRCNADMRTSRETDPRASEFRTWTDAENAGLTDDHFAGRPLRCPVDGSSIRPVSQPTEAGDMVSIKCERCGERYVHRPSQPKD